MTRGGELQQARVILLACAHSFGVTVAYFGAQVVMDDLLVMYYQHITTSVRLAPAEPVPGADPSGWGQFYVPACCCTVLASC